LISMCMTYYYDYCQCVRACTCACVFSLHEIPVFSANESNNVGEEEQSSAENHEVSDSFAVADWSVVPPYPERIGAKSLRYLSGLGVVDELCESPVSSTEDSNDLGEAPGPSVFQSLELLSENSEDYDIYEDPQSRGASEVSFIRQYRQQRRIPISWRSESFVNNLTVIDEEENDPCSKQASGTLVSSAGDDSEVPECLEYADGQSDELGEVPDECLEFADGQSDELGEVPDECLEYADSQSDEVGEVPECFEVADGHSPVLQSETGEVDERQRADTETPETSASFSEEESHEDSEVEEQYPVPQSDCSKVDEEPSASRQVSSLILSVRKRCISHSQYLDDDHVTCIR